MLDVDKIRELVAVMVENDLIEISLKEGEEEINLRRSGQLVPEGCAPPVAVMAQMPQAAPVAPPGHLAGDATSEPPQRDPNLVEIASPIVGTFYTASDPNSPPFVQVGSQVNPDTTVCIIEAMKVFNEIKSEVAGVIEQILVKNEEAVEYGQHMFLVRTT